MKKSFEALFDDESAQSELEELIPIVDESINSSVSELEENHQNDFVQYSERS